MRRGNPSVEAFFGELRLDCMSDYNKHEEIGSMLCDLIQYSEYGCDECPFRHRCPGEEKNGAVAYLKELQREEEKEDEGYDEEWHQWGWRDEPRAYYQS